MAKAMGKKNQTKRSNRLLERTAAEHDGLTDYRAKRFCTSISNKYLALLCRSPSPSPRPQGDGRGL